NGLPPHGALRYGGPRFTQDMGDSPDCGVSGGLWHPLCRGLYLRPCHFGTEQPAIALPYRGHRLFHRGPAHGPFVLSLDLCAMKNSIFILLGGLLGVVLYKSEAASWFRIQEMFRF